MECLKEKNLSQNVNIISQYLENDKILDPTKKQSQKQKESESITKQR